MSKFFSPRCLCSIRRATLCRTSSHPVICVLKDSALRSFLIYRWQITWLGLPIIHSLGKKDALFELYICLCFSIGRSLTHVLTLLRDIDGGAYDTLSQKFRLYAACVGLVDTGYFRKRSGATLPMVNVHSKSAKGRSLHSSIRESIVPGEEKMSTNGHIGLPQLTASMASYRLLNPKGSSIPLTMPSRRDIRKWLLQIQTALDIQKYRHAERRPQSPSRGGIPRR